MGGVAAKSHRSQRKVVSAEKCDGCRKRKECVDKRSVGDPWLCLDCNKQYHAGLLQRCRSCNTLHRVREEELKQQKKPRLSNSKDDLQQSLCQICLEEAQRENVLCDSCGVPCTASKSRKGRRVCAACKLRNSASRDKITRTMVDARVEEPESKQPDLHAQPLWQRTTNDSGLSWQRRASSSNDRTSTGSAAGLSQSRAGSKNGALASNNAEAAAGDAPEVHDFAWISGSSDSMLSRFGSHRSLGSKGAVQPSGDSRRSLPNSPTGGRKPASPAKPRGSHASPKRNRPAPPGHGRPRCESPGCLREPRQPSQPPQPPEASPPCFEPMDKAEVYVPPALRGANLRRGLVALATRSVGYTVTTAVDEIATGFELPNTPSSDAGPQPTLAEAAAAAERPMSPAGRGISSPVRRPGKLDVVEQRRPVPRSNLAQNQLSDRLSHLEINAEPDFEPQHARRASRADEFEAHFQAAAMSLGMFHDNPKASKGRPSMTNSPTAVRRDESRRRSLG